MKTNEILGESMPPKGKFEVKRFAMIGFPVDGKMQSDDFETTKVFTDRRNFEKEVAAQFAYYVDDETLATKKKIELEEHEKWDEFCDNVWMIDKL